MPSGDADSLCCSSTMTNGHSGGDAGSGQGSAAAGEEVTGTLEAYTQFSCAPKTAQK